MADLVINSLAVSAASGYASERAYAAGATISAGAVVYVDSNSRWQLYDSNALAGSNATGVVRGIALHNSANTQPLTVATSGNIAIGATVANGVPYFASNAAGGITATAPIAGEYAVFIGFGISTTRISVQPVAAGVTV
jgi:hypothetical protein